MSVRSAHGNQHKHAGVDTIASTDRWREAREYGACATVMGSLDSGPLPTTPYCVLSTWAHNCEPCLRRLPIRVAIALQPLATPPKATNLQPLYTPLTPQH
eukprot:1361068-Pleurochrysis_carterae.AAC.1